MRNFVLEVSNEVFNAVFDELFDDFQSWFNICSKLRIDLNLYLFKTISVSQGFKQVIFTEWLTLSSPTLQTKT